MHTNDLNSTLLWSMFLVYEFFFVGPKLSRQCNYAEAVKGILKAQILEKVWQN